MPALVLAHAVGLRRAGRGWRAIVQELEQGGNGRYDVRTLTRRIVQILAGQNPRELAGAAAAGDVDVGAVKTSRGRRRAARPGRHLQRRSKLTAPSPRNADLVGVRCPICRRTIRAGEAKRIGNSGYAFHQLPDGRNGHTFAPSAPAGPGTCRKCGCTDAAACPEGCSWVLPDLCSACATPAQLARAFPLSESQDLEA